MRPTDAVDLIAHPLATQSSPVRAVHASLSRDLGGLRIDAALCGAKDALLVPAGTSSVRRDGLWRHTCIEFFAGPLSSTEYLEFNLSPAGEWALYHFKDTRDPLPLPSASPPQVQVQWAGQDLRVVARLAVNEWAVSWIEEELSVGLSAVLESRSGALSYHAIHHPRDVPDFHDRRGWIGRLEATGSRGMT
jgi:hypothetical protein